MEIFFYFFTSIIIQCSTTFGTHWKTKLKTTRWVLSVLWSATHFTVHTYKMWVATQSGKQNNLLFLSFFSFKPGNEFWALPASFGTRWKNDTEGPFNALSTTHFAVLSNRMWKNDTEGPFNALSTTHFAVLSDRVWKATRPGNSTTTFFLLSFFVFSFFFVLWITIQSPIYYFRHRQRVLHRLGECMTPGIHLLLFASPTPRSQQTCNQYPQHPY